MAFFKKKNSDRQAAKAIKAAVQTFKQDRSAQNMQAFANALCSFVAANQQVWVYTRSDWYMEPCMEAGQGYLAFYTTPADVMHTQEDFALVEADISKLLELLFQNRELAGLVINPDSDRMFLDKGLLLKILLHSQIEPLKYQKTLPHQWPAGIPSYTDADKMTEGECLTAAIRVVLPKICVKDSYTLVSANDGDGACPHLILQKAGRIAFVCVTGHAVGAAVQFDAAPLKALAEKYDAEAFYADVEFLSVDPARQKANLLLRDDVLGARFAGLQEV